MPRLNSIPFGNACFEGRMCGSLSVSPISVPNLGDDLVEDQIKMHKGQFIERKATVDSKNE